MIGDCLADPGPLSRDAAVHAMSIHHACPDQCLPHKRAMATINAEFASSTDDCVDERFAQQLSASIRQLRAVTQPPSPLH